METYYYTLETTIGCLIWFCIFSGLFFWKYTKWIPELKSRGPALIPQLIVVSPVFLILIGTIAGITGNLGNIWPLVIFIYNIPLFIINILLYHIVKRIWYN